ncbi:MAG: tetratricopeptide repeat protein [Myxococcota bacterium]
MASKDPNTAAETLAEIEATGDRVAEWASENAALILGTIAAVLVLAAGIGLYVQHGTEARDDAANALALATSQYRQAMGANPGGGPIPEPANLEVAENTRAEYVARFTELGEAHAGTSAGALAWLEAGNLQFELGRLEDAATSFGAARDAAGRTAISALASVRLAALAEDQGKPEDAAGAFESAANIGAYPLRANALADAARCWVEAGDDDRALAAFQRLENEFPDHLVPPYVESLIGEIRARS